MCLLWFIPNLPLLLLPELSALSGDKLSFCKWKLFNCTCKVQCDFMRVFQGLVRSKRTCLISVNNAQSFFQEEAQASGYGIVGLITTANPNELTEEEMSVKRHIQP